MPLSGKGRASVDGVARKYGTWLLENHGSTYEEIGRTASVRREHHEHRLAVVGHSRREWSSRLSAMGGRGADAGTSASSGGSSVRKKVCFVFSGQGPQWFGMGRGLLEQDSAYAKTFREVSRHVERLAGWSLVDELSRSESTSRLQETEIAQVALFALQVSLVAQWSSWGIEATTVIGHSVGEIAAAYVSGILSLESSVELALLRGKLLQSTTGQGRMASVDLSESATEQELPAEGGLWVGASNSAGTTVVSGEERALDALLNRLSSRGVGVKRMP